MQGRRPGEALVRLAEVEVVSVRRESLLELTEADVRREGVPLDVYAAGPDRAHVAVCSACRPLTWAGWFARTMGIDPYAEVTRIEWRYL